jgi:hypothetical protein
METAMGILSRKKQMPKLGSGICNKIFSKGMILRVSISH